MAVGGAGTNAVGSGTVVNRMAAIPFFTSASAFDLNKGDVAKHGCEL